MAERIDLPRLPSGEPEEQLREMYNYLYHMAEALNTNLERIGGPDLTDGERRLMNSMTSQEDQQAQKASAGYNYQEAETLKSLIIKTASWVKSEMDSWRINLFGTEEAEGSFGKYVRKAKMSVDVTPTGTKQVFSFQEIIDGIKEFEINAKNYIKTGYLRTENGLPVYGVAVGKDIVTFAEDGTETYHDGNKVAEFTADKLSFYNNGTVTASYTGTELIFYAGGVAKVKVNADGITFLNGSTKLAELLNTALKFYYNGTLRTQMDTDGIKFYNGSTMLAQFKAGELDFYQNGNLAMKLTATRLGFYNSGTEYMYITGGKVYISSLDGYSTTQQMNNAISSAVSSAVADKVTTTQLQQTASSVETTAKNYTDNKLTSYSTTSQTATEIAQYVANNAYGLISGITIAAAGITMSGSKYISLQSSGYVDIGNWRFNSTGQHYLSNGVSILEFGRYADKSANATGGVYVADNIAYLFATVAYYSANYVAYGYGGDAGVAGPAFFPSHDVQVALGGSSRRWGNAYISTVYYGSLIQSSSRDIKHRIQDMPEMGERLDQLEPVTFIYDDDTEEKTRHGLIYEDTIDVLPEICTGDEEEKAINYVELIPMLLKEIQSLRRRVKQLEDERS